MAAYLGPPLALARVLYEAEHGLEHQAYAPRTMLSGTVNVDGTAIAWWPPEDTNDEPLRYATELAPWADANLIGLAPRLHACALVAAVRSATPGMPGGPTTAAPFVHGRLALAHNGYVEGFGGDLGKHLVDELPSWAAALMTTRTDSLALFAHVAARRAMRPGEALGGALVAVVERVARACREQGVRAQLNLLACEGQELAAVRAGVGLPANTLFTLRDRGAWPGARLLASEPLDDDEGWSEIPEGSLAACVSAGAELVITPLDTERKPS
jgi:glutamine amidotransferase